VQLRQPKVIALYRTDRGRFAIDETGAWQPSNKATLCTATDAGLSVTYLGGLLNSELLDLWYGVRGKTPRDVWRNYEPKPMARMPYRHVEQIVTPEESGLLARVDEALQAGDAARAQALGGELAADASDGELAGAVELFVRAIAQNRRRLLPLRELFPELGRTVKDPWRARMPVLDEAEAIRMLPDEAKASARIDPELTLRIDTDGSLGRGAVEPEGLVFQHSRKVTARVAGPERRIEFLTRMLEGSQRLLPAGLEGTLLPRDLDAFEAFCDARRTEVGELLEEGRVLVETVERLVCRLYDVPAELEEAVVRHAAERAVAGLAPED